MNISDYKNKTDEEIFKGISENPDLFGIIMDRYEKKLSAYIKRNSGSDVDVVNDILQEVFLSVYQNAQSFRYDMQFSSWIYRIAHNKMVDYWRKNKKGKIQISLDEHKSFVETVFHHNDVLEEMEKNELKIFVEKVVMKMKKKYREVLILKFLEQKSYQEISDILQKSTGTVGTLVARAKKDFKKQWKIVMPEKE